MPSEVVTALSLKGKNNLLFKGPILTAVVTALSLEGKNNN